MNCVNYGVVTAIGAMYPMSGGILGYGGNGVVQNCLSLSNPVIKNATNGSVGMIAGTLFNCPMKNCYYWSDTGYKKGIGKIEYSAVVDVKDNAVKKTEKEIKEKSFVKSLGSAFVYAKNDRPYLACDLNSPVAEKTATTTTTKTTKPTATVKNGKATIKWSAVSGAESYIVYKKQSNGKYKKLTTTAKTSVTIKNIKDGTNYELLIKAVYENGSKKTIKNGKFSFEA